ncbi:MAG: hypothetical protein ABF294_09425 [Flavobacteriales bacterium]|nr:hypothetical protein [Flavobacteriales bacterium]
MKLLLNSPLWYVLLCIAIAGLGAFLLYRKDRNLAELSTLWKRVLAALRFLSLFFLAFLLLEPLLEYSKKKVEKPIIVLAHDNSESMVFANDSVVVKSQLEESYNSLKAKLSADYEVVSYSVGDKVSENPTFDFKDKQTNLSEFFTEIQNRYYNRNLGGIVLASDGIYNSGGNPVFEAKKLKNVPVFSIQVGDTTPQKDLLIEEISHNRLVYKGNKFPVVVTVKAEQLNGVKTNVVVSKNGRVLGKKPISVNNDLYLTQSSFELESERTGLQKYDVRVETVNGEFTTTNNYKSFYVDVLESKQKILILANSPHPDINALKLGFQSNENYEVTTNLAQDFKDKIEEFSLIVLYNLPSQNEGLSLLKDKEVPLLMVVGNQTNVNSFNALKKGVTINNSKGFTEAQAYVNTDFSQFTISPGLVSFVNSFPPVQVPFTQKYSVSNSTETAIYQRIGPVKTKYPLLAFNKNGAYKTGMLLGEGIWRWRLQDYSNNGSSDLFNELIVQTAQYLVSKEDKSLFRVFRKTAYSENEKVQFEAEVYNKSYELVTTSDANMKIFNEQKEEFSYTFSKVGDSYKLNSGSLKPGSYTYVATSTSKGGKLTRTGEFSVEELKVEQNNTVANHQLLFNLSDVTGGEVLSISGLSSLDEKLKKQENLVDVIYQEKDVDDLINMKVIFFFILLLLGIEWFVRKRNGGY